MSTLTNGHSHTNGSTDGKKGDDLLPVSVVPSDIGFISFGDVRADSMAEANRILDENHHIYHMFIRDVAGHNHIAHAILSHLAIGASPEQLRHLYDYQIGMQRAMPPLDTELLEKLDDDEVFYQHLEARPQYYTFLCYFERQMEKVGWKAVLQRYLFARTKVAEAMLTRLYEGAYHSLIHLGYGIEFKSPAIIAEALGQAAAHDDSGIDALFRAAENEATYRYPTEKGVSLMQLMEDTRNNEVIRNAPKWSDYGNKMRDGIVGRALEDMSGIVSQFRILPREEDLERRTAEMIGFCAFASGAAQRKGRPNKIDFFFMHTLNSALFLTVLIRQEWIHIEDRVRLVERKGRLDLAWYAVVGCPVLDAESITNYHGPSDDLGWDEIFEAVNKETCDGHTAKFLRGLRLGQIVSRRYMGEEKWSSFFPMKNDMWLKLARLCHDSTTGLATDLKWVSFTGFEQPWKRPDLQAKATNGATEEVTAAA